MFGYLYVVFCCIGIICRAQSANGQENRISDKASVAIGSRIEMFVDDWLIERQQNVRLLLTPPIRREVVLVTDKPREGVDSAYYTVIQDGRSPLTLATFTF